MSGDRNPFQSDIDAIDAALNAAQQPQAPVVGGLTPPPVHPFQSDIDSLDAALKQPPTGVTPSALLPTDNRGWSGYIEDVGSNMATGILKGIGNLVGLPNVAGRLGDWAMDRYNANMAASSPSEIWADPMTGSIPTPSRPPDETPGLPGLLTRHTYSPEELNKRLFSDIDYGRQLIGKEPRGPYEPTTMPGRLGQAALSNVIPSLLGPEATLVPRLVAGGGAGIASQGLHEVVPDAPIWADLLASVAGGSLANAGRAALAAPIRATRRLLSDPLAQGSYAQRSVEGPVAESLAKAGGQTGEQLAATIEKNLPLWTPGSSPDLGNVTLSPGIRGLVYQDMTAAKKAETLSPIYEQKAAQTNEAQRTAIAGARPDTAAVDLQAAIDARDAAVAKIPPGATAQEAGEQFRSDMQTVMDQRTATRSAGGGQFGALENNPARINMQPVMDYATERAAKTAGAVGDAYKAALSQFKSGTGITLDTADFGSSVLTGLGDLAASLRATPAAQRAVLDVKTRLEQTLSSQVPEVGQARATWAANSRPLDIFEQKPFGAALAKDQYGRFYNMPNDQVAESFLRGNGSADALDKLHHVFQDPEQATRGLQNYLAGKVRETAVGADGTIDPTKLKAVLAPYQNAMMRFPELQKTFSNAKGAQAALDQQQAYQTLYQQVEKGLGSQQLDRAENQFYSPKQFRDFVDKNSALIDKAYSPEQAAVVRRVHDELQNMAQTPYAKVPGTSGTAQLLPTPKGEGSSLTRTILGYVIGNWVAPGVGGEAGALLASGTKGIGSHLAGQPGKAYEAVMRNALTDPAYAKGLLERFDPSGVNTPAAERAMAYVASRTPWLAYANTAAGQQPPAR